METLMGSANFIVNEETCIRCGLCIRDCLLKLIEMGDISCWGSIFTRICDKALPAGLAVPEGNKLYGAVMPGKPSVACKRVPYRPIPDVEWK